MSPPRDDLVAAGAKSLRLSAIARIALGAVGAGLLVTGAIGLLALRLDGAGITAFVISGSVLAGLGAMGWLPTQLKLKDVEVGWQIQREERNAAALAAVRPAADDESLLEKAAIPESPTDLTLPLFEDPSRLADLAAISPKAALLAVYGELEEQLRGLARDSGVLPGDWRFWQLGRVMTALVDHNWLNGWHASVLRSLSSARNAVAHAPSDVPDIEVSALLALTVDTASEVKVRRRAALAGYKPKPGLGPAVPQ